MLIRPFYPKLSLFKEIGFVYIFRIKREAPVPVEKETSVNGKFSSKTHDSRDFYFAAFEKGAK